MKTKEEILQGKLESISKGNTTQIQFCYDAIFSAMEEYADQFKQLQKEELREAFKIGYNYAYLRVIDFEEWYNSKHPQP